MFAKYVVRVMTPNHRVLFGLGLETGVDQVSEMLGHARQADTAGLVWVRDGASKRPAKAASRSSSWRLAAFAQAWSVPPPAAWLESAVISASGQRWAVA